jgi:predicted phosphohydrolase
MDITFISDTHGLHHTLHLDSGTILMHAGDISEYGTLEELRDFISWFSSQPFDYKIFVAGNHDFCLQQYSASRIAQLAGKDIIYLQDSSVEISGIKIWGSPVTNYFMGMAFNVRAGADIKKVWDRIPPGTDILLTHCPPKGILDDNIGSEELLDRVVMVRPRIHCFGHAHGLSGKLNQHGITFINAALASQSDPFRSDNPYLGGKPIKVTV